MDRWIEELYWRVGKNVLNAWEWFAGLLPPWGWFLLLAIEVIVLMAVLTVWPRA